MCLDPLGIEQFFSLDEICAIEKKNYEVSKPISFVFRKSLLTRWE